MLKSNGLHRPKIRLKKFSFSLKIVPAYISKKLPSQCWPKPLFIAFFNFSHKRPTFAFTGENEYILAFLRKIAHNGSHAETGGLPFCDHSAAFYCQRDRSKQNDQKKRDEGKPYMASVGHACRKMVSIIYAVMRDNKAYTPCIPNEIST